MRKLFKVRGWVTTTARILEASPLSWGKVEPSPLALKRKGLDLSVGGLQHKFAFDRKLKIASQYFSELLSLMKAKVNDPSRTNNQIVDLKA